MDTKKTILYVEGSSDTIWIDALSKVLSGIGRLETTMEKEAIKAIRQLQPTMIIVDAVASSDTVNLVSEIRDLQPSTPIVVVTTSPTWKRARAFFQAGATDYTRKSLEFDSIMEISRTILDRP